jgi:orotidine-5'-phosphate decarboxylase
MPAFAQRLAARVAAHGPLCVGIDPSADLLARCGLPDTADGAFAFGRLVLEAADYALPIVKPQSAYFERHGSAGIAALERLAALARAHDVLVLLDGKRGDIDATAEAYAQAYFAPGVPLLADALTLHAYLGLAAMERAIDFAVAQGGGVFVVVRSSNPEGRDLQLARRADGRTVAQALADDVQALNRRHVADAPGPVGAVVGATCPDAGEIVDAMPGAWILAPGVGAQGATFEDIARRMPGARGRVLPNVSRAVLSGGASAAQIGATIAELKRQALALA